MMSGDPDTGMGRDAQRFATFAEKQPATPISEPPPSAFSFGDGARALARQWQVLGRVATGAAVLTAPLLFLVFYRVLEWGPAAAVLITALAVFAFRGLFDVIARRLIPSPTLYSDDGTLRDADVSARRRVWFWRFWFKTAWILAIAYGLVVVVIYAIDAIRGEANIGRAAEGPFGSLADQFGGADASSSFIGIAVGIPVIFFVNTLIFLGPLAYAGLKQIKYYEPGDADWGVRMDDVRGQDRPKEEIHKIVTLWQSGEEFERAGGKRERGVLFFGAPGTGKTMLAKAIATGFNCPFVTAPGPAFSQSFIGVDVILVMWMSWRARRLARKWGGKCIVFIDEIDAIGGTRTGVVGHSLRPSLHDVAFHGPLGALNRTGDLILETEAWRERLFLERDAPAAGDAMRGQRVADRVRRFVFPGTGGIGQGGLQQLLVEMDGVATPPPFRRMLTNKLNTLLDATYLVPSRIGRLRLRLRPARPRREELYFIGACNVPTGALDRALTRPGRMGRHIRFRTPDRASRMDIFDLYLGKVSHDPELDAEGRRQELARITMGHSPAMIEQVCSLALTNAHHDGRRECNWSDLVSAITVVEEGIEAGISFIPSEARAIAIHEAGHAVTGHVYMKDWMSTRLTIKARSIGLGHHAMSELDERFSRFQHEQFANLVWTLGAMAAELVFYGENSVGVGGDVESATASSALMVGMWGMAPVRPDPGSLGLTPVEAETAERKLMRRYERVGTRIMNRASQGSEADGSPIAAVLADPVKRAMVAQLLGQAFLTAYWFVAHNRDGTQRVAEALLEHEEMFGDEVVELLDGVGLSIPEVDPLDEANWPRI